MSDRAMSEDSMWPDPRTPATEVVEEPLGRPVSVRSSIGLQQVRGVLSPSPTPSPGLLLSSIAPLPQCRGAVPKWRAISRERVRPVRTMPRAQNTRLSGCFLALSN
ncbi:hypothetical protein [Streptomyces coeruleorubidus]|uniref:hypothetical protein n=1 Tax=Streptomyces coeruleorubidus TaxID=116188 RepID=UPI0033D436F5